MCAPGVQPGPCKHTITLDPSHQSHFLSWLQFWFGTLFHLVLLQNSAIVLKRMDRNGHLANLLALPIGQVPTKKFRNETNSSLKHFY